MSNNIDLKKIRGVLEARGFPIEDLYEGAPPKGRDNVTCHLDLNNRNVVATWTSKPDLACLMAVSTELSRKPKSIKEQVMALPRAKRDEMLIEMMTSFARREPLLAAGFGIVPLDD